MPEEKIFTRRQLQQFDGETVDASAQVAAWVAAADDGEDAETLLANADMAMYKAKGAGGNRVSGPE